jgi:DNA-binding transcriptional ArsR family regulator
MKQNSTGLPVEFLERVAQTLKVLAHAQRLKIVEVLQARGPQPVHALQAALGLPQPLVSIHLNQMKRAGLLESERRQKEIWYRLLDPSALTILDCIRKKHQAQRKG